MIQPVFIVFCGLPGTGKTTLARAVARALPALNLRLDRVESELRQSGALTRGLKDSGYRVTYGLAADNLRLGHNVVADCVNGTEATRQGFAEAAKAGAGHYMPILLDSRDRAEHRRRIESRTLDLKGLSNPNWKDVERRRIDPWPDDIRRLDTTCLSLQEATDQVIKWARAGRI